MCIDPGWITATSNGEDIHRLALINRKVAYYLKDKFEVANYKVVMTVPQDNLEELYNMYTNDSTNDEIGYFPAVSNSSRASVCNDASADYMISVHHNTSEDTSVNYTRVYFYYGHSESWGDKTHAAVESAMETTPRNDGVGAYGKANYAILTGIDSDMPGIMVFASFYSNPDEEARLNNNLYLEGEAAAIFEAFIDSN